MLEEKKIEKMWIFAYKKYVWSKKDPDPKSEKDVKSRIRIRNWLESRIRIRN